MASMVAKASSSSCPIQVLPMASIQEKGSRNKRKFRADPPLGDPSKIMSPAQNECPGYEFSAEKFETAPGHGQSSACDLCGVNQYHSDGLKLDLGLSSALGSSEVGPTQPRGEVESEESHDADWSDLTESQLEELVLSNLDAIFKGAIKKIVACGYTEEEATKAILRSGLCYGCKYTVSNIVDNTLALLRNGHDIEPSREHCFEDLQQLGRYVLAELVCVLREVRPFFSTGDAMWCLLICDMNVSHACAMDGDPLSSFATDGASNGTTSVSTQPQLKPEAKFSELNLPNPCSQSETSTNVTGVPKNTKPKNCAVLNGLVSDKEGSNSTVDDKSSNIAGSSQSTVLEEKFIVSRKVHSGVNKREYILRQKSVHLEKSYRTYGSKASRAGKLSGLGGLILDKKLKSVSDSTSVNIKNASLRLSKAMGVDVPQDNRNLNLPSNPSSHVTFNSVSSSTSASIPKTDISSALPPVSVLPVLPTVNTPPASSAADTELSLSLPAKSNSTLVPTSCSAEAPMSSYAGILYDKSLTQWVPHDKKDEMIMKLIPRARELQNQLQEWTEWANQKVMQAARRLGKDKAELKSLRQEKEEVERHKKEKQTLEESTMKKLTEMENALCKASGQVEIANSAVQRLEVENAALRQEMEAAKLRAVESAASCQEVSNSSEQLKKAIAEMLAGRKARKFTETVELQIGLRDYDPEKDKRFNGSIRLPNVPAPNRKVGLIGTAVHCDQAKKVDIGCIDVEGAKKFNKDKKLIKKWAKPFDVLLASESLMKQIPKLMGNTLNKIGKFPVAIGENEKVEDKVKEIKSTVRFQLKKVLCMGTAVGVATMNEEELRQNINMSINFLVSLLKKGWQNIKTLHIKTTMGKPVRIFG